MQLTRTSMGAAIRCAAAALAAMVWTCTSAHAQLPPPGAYRPIPNFTGVGAGLQFRTAINNRFSGVQPISPTIVSLAFANLPIPADGMLFYCQDCKRVAPCAGSGSGAWARATRGVWSCATEALEANLNANGNKLTGLANGTAAGDALVFGQAGGNDLSGPLPNPIVQTVLDGKAPLYSNQAKATLVDSPPPAVACSSVGQVAGGGSITFPKPSCLAAGMLEVASFFIQANLTITPPSGWTPVRSDSAGGMLVEYFHVAGSSEPSSYQWTWTGGQYAVGGIMAITGANVSAPIDSSTFASVGGTSVTLSPLTIAAPSELVLVFGAGSSGYAQAVSFSRGTLAWQQTPGGNLPHSAGAYTQVHPAGSSVVATTSFCCGGSATLSAAQIAIKAASVASASPILQGDAYAELVSLAGSSDGGTPSIAGFNNDGLFNVRNPAYAGGARGDNLTDDTLAIQAAYDAACAAAAIDPIQTPTVYFPAGRYRTTFSIIMSCGSPINVRGDGEYTSIINASVPALGPGQFPIFYVESPQNITDLGAFLAPSLATGAGNSLNFPGSKYWYVNLKDATQGNNGSAVFHNAQPLNGMASISVELFAKMTGTGFGQPYIMASFGDDLYRVNGIDSAVDIHVQPGSPNTLTGCFTTSGSGQQCVSTAGNFTPDVVHAIELNYDGSFVRLFLDGVQIGASQPATGTIVQKPAENFVLGNKAQFNGINVSSQFQGQLDSIRISDLARHTSNFTAPSTKFGSDGNTMFLMNIAEVRDTLIKVDTVTGSGAVPKWIPIHNFDLLGGSANNRISYLGFSGGSYSVLAVGSLYLNLEHLAAGGLVCPIRIYNNSYGAHLNHLFLNAAAFGEAALEISGASGLVKADWLTVMPGYYGLNLTDAGGVYSQLFISPGSQTLNDLNAASSVVFHDYVFEDVAVDFETGGSQVPVKVSQSGTYEFIGGDLQDGMQNAIQINPKDNGIGVTLIGTHVETSGTPAPLIGFIGTTSPGNPVMWINPVINGRSLGASGVALADDLTKAQAIADQSSLKSLTLGNGGILSSVTNGVANTTPTVSACGSSPNGSVVAGGTNNAFAIVVGGGTQTSCAVAMGSAAAFANQPVCVAEDITAGAAMKQVWSDANHVTLTQPASADMHGDTINVNCIGK
ncbi:MAG: LamG-like jellyroll fold domain-containing protein [Candidatus Binatus sp.]|uniref:LamG-like jellyroll fold domain-containing protein n=1 Tax=Candidatus Binatus sp. TaxID=2811406 RepID=UPI0027252DF4|nr:LamG-like jellyroll fold domain-containing protein [Candidatus Binatus sp.]MDO8431608.1 LamG-like jellyroll fold domain-containing protein [Candidatus Binatus sp.]